MKAKTSFTDWKYKFQSNFFPSTWCWHWQSAWNKRRLLWAVNCKNWVNYQSVQNWVDFKLIRICFSEKNLQVAELYSMKASLTHILFQVQVHDWKIYLQSCDLHDTQKVYDQSFKLTLLNSSINNLLSGT